ncbi:hypothetical protein FNF31_05342 [Cafeteria roenbergensis]|uniref:Uncharacterized protein n=1 Tax=Cafeteria roenbergensis TaxID=33653 RepID=A0A5A8D3V3_CAFRO|nr:hypothetical protein FNF31_05342 [Cafeteria roenbergensis]KAA0171073.1 hypothetical protein FNF28_01078 [Cafeteria roenbergensis]
MDPEVHALTAEQARVGEVFDAMPRSMVLGITPEYIHTLQAAAKHPRIFRDLVDPILDGIQNLPHKPPLRTPSEIEGCKDQDSIAATMLLWLASHEGKVSDMGKATGDFLREFTTNLLNWRRELMKASTTGRAYLGARGPDIATIAFPETEVEGVQGVQALVEQATAATGPAGAAPPEERLAPMLSPREEILAASASVMDAARVAQDSHSETPLPHASLLSPQRTIPTTPRTAAKAAALEGKARHVRRAVSFSEKAISHSNDAATRALHRQLSRLFDEGSQADGEDASDADLRSAALGEVRTAWRSGAEKLSAVPTRGAAAESAEEEEAYSPVELSTEVYKAMMLDARAFGASLSAVAQVCHAVADCVCNYGKASLPVGLGQIIVKQARVMLAQFWTLRKSATLVMSSTMEVRARRRVLRDRKEFASTVTHTLEESLHELHESVASYEGGKRELARREAALKGWELETQALLIEAKHDVEAQIAESSRLVAGLREKLDAALKEVKEEQRKVVIAQQCKPTLDWYRNRAEELEKELAATKLRVAALEHKLSIQ